jgi:hypothetical protein
MFSRHILGTLKETGMSESVQFWLENKMSAGIKMAAIGDQVLVAYREKYYVIEKDAARTKGGKPLRYSMSSMPALWKRALRGETLPPDSLAVPADDALPVPTAAPKREQVRKPNPRQSPNPAAQPSDSVQKASVASAPSMSKTPKIQKRVDIKPLAQATVTAACPHCNNRHELLLERGKNGKPFFMVCEKCTTEFAVRFVPVMMFQAQVAAFR